MTTASSVITMKEQFYDKFMQMCDKKANNSQIFLKYYYEDLILKERELKSKTTGKKPKGYQLLNSVGDFDRQIFPIQGDGASIKYYVYNEELFQIIHKTYLSIGKK